MLTTFMFPTVDKSTKVANICFRKCSKKRLHRRNKCWQQAYSFGVGAENGNTVPDIVSSFVANTISTQDSFEQNICSVEVHEAMSAQCQNTPVINDLGEQISSDILHVLTTPQSSPRESFKQVVVQAQVHETTLRQDKALRWKNVLLENDPCDQTGPGDISTQTDWDIIESDVDFARYTPISATQEESISTTQEYNKFSASEPDSDKYNFSFETDNCDNSDCANLEGNRIVNIAYLFQQLKNIRHDPFECNLQNSVILTISFQVQILQQNRKD
ncbi:unnamed protein product [Parnassius apollo]|uniref:(apollo) hypothetical protein n=1 Tax=Parnassius apollo TaxID=110799 RepID=A0A8S3XGC2_PARAO|nr:unnamed protein product [Parnassius apollo]